MVAGSRGRFPTGGFRCLPGAGKRTRAVAALRTENAQITATLRAHDLLVQALRVRIAKLKKQAFGKSSEKIEREIEQLELALEDLQVAMAEADTAPPEDRVTDEDDTVADEDDGRKPRRRPRVSDATPRERRELDPGDSCPDCGGDLRIAPKARIPSWRTSEVRRARKSAS